MSCCFDNLSNEIDPSYNRSYRPIYCNEIDLIKKMENIISNFYEPIIPGIFIGVLYPDVMFMPLSATILTRFKLLPSGGESEIFSPGLIFRIVSFLMP